MHMHLCAIQLYRLMRLQGTDLHLLLQQVAKNFREIFSELAPGGSGQLIMQKRILPDPQAEPDSQGEEEDAGPSDKHGAMDRYTGVKVKV